MQTVRYAIFLLLLSLFIGVGCNENSKVEQEIDAIPLEVEVVRFDQLFASAKTSDLPALKTEYPFFFPPQFADSVWEQRLIDTLQIQLNTEVAKVFPLGIDLEADLTDLFKHVAYYFPDFEPPLVYTTTSDVDYQTRIIAAEDKLFIELDTFLGADHPFYEGISNYVSKNLKPSQILPDVAAVLSKRYIELPRNRHLLSQCIYYGKQLYLKDLWLPDVSDAEKIGYTEQELQWAKENEDEIWRYFIESELLYSSDRKLPGRFINPAPFSKFNLAIDNESPGMIGRWVGWQIVKSYVENNTMAPQELLLKSSDEIYRNSKYKPKK